MENTVIKTAFEVTTFVQRYTSCMSKSSQSTLELAVVVSDAKNNLSKEQFKEFCTAIGYETSSATISKMVKIGEKYDVLKPHTDKLPASWTTLYYIAQQPDDVIKADIESSFINPLMTGKDLVKYGCHPQGKKNATEKTSNTKPEPTAEPTPEPLSIKVIMHDKPIGDKALQIKSLIEQLRSLGVEFVMGEEMKAVLQINEEV